MIHLLLVSLLWAPSFGLVARHLKGVDPNFIAAARILLSLLIFAPFLRPKEFRPSAAFQLVALGALQFGLMYVLYIRSFSLGLNGAQVALFTIFTPLLVTLFDDLLQRRISWLFLLSASLTVAGTGIIQWTELRRDGLVAGFLLMQCSNACFALGQVLYRRLQPRIARPDTMCMPYMYLGAAIVACIAAAGTFRPQTLTSLAPAQWIVLAYLGLIASGVGFFLFNAGARRVDLGALAIFNNVKVPLAVLVSVLIFKDPVIWWRLALGGTIIAVALLLNETILRRRPALSPAPTAHPASASDPA